MKYYGHDLKGTHFPFNFSLLNSPWHAAPISRLIQDYEAALPRGGWPNWVLGNHDRPRIAERVGCHQAREFAAMLLLTLRGTPTLYYGDEIGMMQVTIPTDCIRDPFQKNVPGLNVGRDGCRTPMQWDATAACWFLANRAMAPARKRFSTEKCCRPAPRAKLALQPLSALIALRRSRRALTSGSYRPILTSKDLLLFARECEDDRVLVALNLGDRAGHRRIGR